MSTNKPITIIFTLLITFQLFAGVNTDSSGIVETYVIDTISIEGNKITKNEIILRELTFNKADIISNTELAEVFERSKENLLKTSLFNFVYIDYIKKSNKQISVIVKVDERWYTWPAVYFNHADRNLSTWVNSMDFSRVNYGVGITRYNFRGRKEKIFLSVHWGYTNLISFTYNNLYLDKKRIHSLSFEAFIENQNKLDYAASDNKPLQLKYDSHIFNKQSYFIHYSYRKRLYQNHKFIISYFNYNIADTVVVLNNNFLGKARDHLEFMAISYTFENDHRNIKYYPLKGAYFWLLLSYSGIINPEIIKPNIMLSYSRFWELNKRVYSFAGILTSISIKRKQPYVLKTSLGYDYYLRGYEHNLINGQNYIVFKSDLKFNIIPYTIINLKFLPFRQFNKIHFSSYLNIFLNAGYMYDYYYPDNEQFENSLVNNELYSFGMGIDVVTYYDKMLRVDFARNSLNEWGFFVSVKQKL